MSLKWVVTCVVLLLCVEAVFCTQSCFAQEPSAPDRAVVASAFEAVAKRHTAPGPLALECSRFRRSDQASLGGVAADLPRIEGVKTMRIGGRDLATLKKGTLFWDGADKWRFEWLSLTTGGPERARTAVTILTPTSTCEASQLDGAMCKYFESPVHDVAQQTEALADGRTPHERIVAHYGYLMAVRYMLEWLARAPDLTGRTLGDGRLLVLSEALRFGAVIDQRRGIVEQIRYCNIKNRTDIVNYVGEVPGISVHHPERAIAWKLEGNHVADADAACPPESAIGVTAGLETYAAAPLKVRVDDSFFDWRSVAKKSVDYNGNVTKADGTAIPKPEQHQAPPMPTEASDDQGPDRMFLSAGLALLLVGGVSVVKRMRANGE